MAACRIIGRSVDDKGSPGTAFAQFSCEAHGWVWPVGVPALPVCPIGQIESAVALGVARIEAAVKKLGTEPPVG